MLSAGRASVLDVRVAPGAHGKRLLSHHHAPVLIKLSVTFSPRSGPVRSFRRYGINLTSGQAG
jgi:hypothetical protein